MIPSPEIVRAFQCAGAVERLEGGEGRSVRVANCVLKPVENAPRYGWACDLLLQIPRKGFRISEPRRTLTGAYVCHGWGAATYEPGKPIRGEWVQKLEVSRSFHALLHQMSPPPMPPGDDIWSRAHEIAWDDSRLPKNWHPEMRRTIAYFRARYRPVSRARSIIHADICGNIMFRDGLEPCIIDFSPAYGSSEYADAILVADAIAWENAPLEIVDLLPFDERYRQYLMRAICFRVAVTALFAPDNLETFRTEVRAFEPIITLIYGRAPA